jgi:LmbE family N-acetylglucosaminyl deacetylase
MMRLDLQAAPDGKLEILCLGSHSDDIEIGCGGTILRLAEQYPGCAFHWVVFSATGVRENEARSSASLFAGSALKDPLIKAFPDGFMPFVGGELKTVLEELKKTISPDLIFTHYRKDAHQDHRQVSELTWNTFRDHLILEYEIPKYDGDIGQPNLFIPLEQHIYERKIRYLLDSFPSQRSKRWFQEDTFLSLMRLRGVECNAPSGHAEAFYGRKLVL